MKKVLLPVLMVVLSLSYSTVFAGSIGAGLGLGSASFDDENISMLPKTVSGMLSVDLSDNVMVRGSIGFAYTSMHEERTPMTGTKSTEDNRLIGFPIELEFLPFFTRDGGRVRIYPGAGFGFYHYSYKHKTKYGNTSTEPPTEHYSGFGQFFLLGLEAKLTDNLSLFSEWSKITFAVMKHSYEETDYLGNKIAKVQEDVIPFKYGIRFGVRMSLF